MFEIIGDVILHHDFIYGMCVSAILTTIVYIIATYIDHVHTVKIARKRAYESLDLLFSDNYWEQRLSLAVVLPDEIVLPEV